ncbi:MAG TPA: SpoIIE family protein phosphatase [Bacteroidales bacterium]|nr:SpoIIE family protein phosphatase [Bacteroidales bacterium]
MAKNDPIKIMIVDDELDLEILFRQKFRKQLKESEWRFEFAANGLQALALLLEHPDTSIILSDINMPEMDGLTLLARLNELKNPALKTVIVSAYGDMDNIRTAMNRGAFDFITKPINFDDLEITIHKTIEQIRILYKANEEHEELVALQHDLNIAAEIQHSILPKKFPPFPDRTDFDIHAFMNAAKSVGGDFYDFFLIDQDHIGLVIADVSDKGIPAAIYMAVSRTIIRAAAIKGLPPKECLEYSNQLLCKENVNQMFVTVFYGILNTQTGEFHYTNGGHNPPYVISRGGMVRSLEKTGDVVLGAIDDVPYHQKSTKFQPGEALFLYTDGVTEAMNVNYELFSEARLESALKAASQNTPGEIILQVSSAIENFTLGAQQSDDITMMVVRYNPA